MVSSTLRLLLASNHLELRRRLFLLLLLRSLLRDLTPATTCALALATIEISLWSGLDDTLVHELLATNKLLGKASAIECLRAGVDAVRDDLHLVREGKQVLNESVGCIKLVMMRITNGTRQLTINTTVQTSADLALGPFHELLLRLGLFRQVRISTNRKRRPG